MLHMKQQATGYVVALIITVEKESAYALKKSKLASLGQSFCIWMATADEAL